MWSVPLCLHTGTNTSQGGLVVPENQLGLSLTMRVLRGLLYAALRADIVVRAQLLRLRRILFELIVQLASLPVASAHQKLLIRRLLGLAHLMVASGGG